MVEKNDSARALSQHWPVRPTEENAELACQGGELLEAAGDQMPVTMTQGDLAMSVHAGRPCRGSSPGSGSLAIREQHSDRSAKGLSPTVAK